MTSQQRIDRIANGLWLSKNLRNESVEELDGRLKHQLILTFVFFVPFIVLLFVDFEALLGHKVAFLYVISAFAPVIMLFCVVLTRRLINLRKAIDGAKS